MDSNELRKHVQAAGLTSFSPETAPTIQTGSQGPYVDLLHRLLRAALPDWQGTPDYDQLTGKKFTGNTHTTAKSFQAGNYLLNDGVVGYKSWMALSGMEAFQMAFEPPAGAYLTQSKKTRCWAASTATLKGLTNEIQASPTRTYYLDQVGGLMNDDPAQAWKDNSKNFANDMNLHVVTDGATISGILYLMVMRGRVMLNSRNLHDGNSHYHVLVTARGDGSEKGTTIGFWDPYPANNQKGQIMYRSYSWLKHHYKDLTYRIFYSPTGDGKS